MDNTIRRNEICIIGLPRCDFVFSSTRTCFIAYGFKESRMEMTIIRNLLSERGIQPIEAGGSLAPGQSAFCAKICSKIITAQFCIILLNNEEAESGREIPNANVNMEYGLMLGFNKAVIPFQREHQRLPFNVAGLDTIKYTSENFEQRARDAIDQTIKVTVQNSPAPYTPDQVLQVFLLTKKALVTQVTQGEAELFRIGSSLGFNLLNDFSALNYIFFGNFTAIRSEVVVWRTRLLVEILEGRRASFVERVYSGLMTKKQSERLDKLFDRLQIWIVVTSNSDKDDVGDSVSDIGYRVESFSLDDISTELEKLAPPSR